MQKFYIKNNADIEKYMKTQETFYSGELLDTIEFVGNCAADVNYLNNLQQKCVDTLINDNKKKADLHNNYEIVLNQLVNKNKFRGDDFANSFSANFYTLVDRYISTVKNTFIHKNNFLYESNRGNYLTKHFGRDKIETTNYHLIVPDSFVTKKHQLELNNNLKSIKELHANYVLALELNRDYQKIAGEIKNNKQFISNVDNFIAKTTTTLQSVYKIKNEVVIGRMESVQSFLYQGLVTLSPMVKKLRGLDLELDKWEILESNTESNFFDTDAYIIVYKVNGAAQILGKYPGSNASLCNAQLFPTAKEATKVARRTTTYYGKNFTVVKIGLSTKEIVHSEGETIPEVIEMNSLKEKRDIEAFFENNELEKIREKLKEYETHTLNNDTNKVISKDKKFKL